jgi:hypothetical protein
MQSPDASLAAPLAVHLLQSEASARARALPAQEFDKQGTAVEESTGRPATQHNAVGTSHTTDSVLH